MRRTVAVGSDALKTGKNGVSGSRVQVRARMFQRSVSIQLNLEQGSCA